MTCEVGTGEYYEKLNSARKPPRLISPKRRKCLGRLNNGQLHDELFDSLGPGDRICSECKKTAIYKGGANNREPK